MRNNKSLEKSNIDKKLFEAYRREQMLHDTIENNSIRVEKIIEEKEKIKKVIIKIQYIYNIKYFY